MNRSKSAELTIVMPVFNKKEYVKVMIDSIIANTYQDWELLAVDDGSDEATKSLLSCYDENDSRVRYIQREEPPKGAQTCRNIGLREAKGEFIIFFDSDDYVTPVCLGRRVAALKVRQELDFLVFPSGIFVEGKFQPHACHDVYGYKLYKDDVKHFAARQLPFVVCNNIYRLSSLKKYRLQWDTQLSSLQDADFNLQALLSGLTYDYVATDPDYGYRLSFGQASVSSSITRSQSSNLYAVNKFYDGVQRRYGHKYDRALYLGAINILNRMSYSGLNADFCTSLCTLMDHYDTKRSNRLRAKMKMALALEPLAGGRRTRQLALLPEIISMQMATIYYNHKRTCHQ